MSSKEQKTPEGKPRKKLSWISTKRLRQLSQKLLLSRWIRAMKKLRISKLSWLEAQTRERDGILRVKAEMENLRRRTELDIEKAHKFALEKFINELLPVIDSPDRALEVADKANPDMSAMVEGIELTLEVDAGCCA